MNMSELSERFLKSGNKLNYVDLRKIINHSNEPFFNEELFYVATSIKGFHIVYWIFTEKHFVFYDKKENIVICHFENTEECMNVLDKTTDFKGFSLGIEKALDVQKNNLVEFNLKAFFDACISEKSSHSDLYKDNALDKTTQLNNMIYSDEMIEKLEELGRLLDLDVLNDEEFKVLKAEIFNKYYY